jgi:hypothetical protein
MSAEVEVLEPLGLRHGDRVMGGRADDVPMNRLKVIAELRAEAAKNRIDLSKVTDEELDEMAGPEIYLEMVAPKMSDALRAVSAKLRGETSDGLPSINEAEMKEMEERAMAIVRERSLALGFDFSKKSTFDLMRFGLEKSIFAVHLVRQILVVADQAVQTIFQEDRRLSERAGVRNPSEHRWKDQFLIDDINFSLSRLKTVKNYHGEVEVRFSREWEPHLDRLSDDLSMTLREKVLKTPRVGCVSVMDDIRPWNVTAIPLNLK